MMFDKKYVLATLLFLIFITMSSVCAGDVGNSTSVGTIGELNNTIQSLEPGDICNIQKDYKFNYPGMYDSGIPIYADNVTVNGNNHVIDGGNLYALFNVIGNDVKICNFTFINSKDTITLPCGSSVYGSSPITWNGDNGVICDCKFSQNTAVNGGAMTWMGNNGTIDNCIFINSTARGAGGALYIGGENNTVSSCVFMYVSSG